MRNLSTEVYRAMTVRERRLLKDSWRPHYDAHGLVGYINKVRLFLLYLYSSSILFYFAFLTIPSFSFVLCCWFVVVSFDKVVMCCDNF